MSYKLNKFFLIIIFFILQISRVFACSIENLEQSYKTILSIHHQILSIQYNLAFLEEKKQAVIKKEKQISSCIQKNVDTIQEFENIKKNIKNINLDNHDNSLYQENIETIKNNTKLCEKILLASQRTINAIQQSIQQAYIIDKASQPHYDINALLLNYKAADEKIIFKPISKTFPATTRLYKNNPIFFYTIVLVSLLLLSFGFLLFHFFKKIQKNNVHENIRLFIYYTKYITPWYLLIIPFEIYLSHKTVNYLIKPSFISFLDFIFRAMHVYILALFALCFFMKNSSLKISSIKLLNQSNGFIFIIGFIQMCYLTFLEKTAFIQLVYVLFFLPIFFIGINYYVYKWATLPNLPMNHLQMLAFRAICFATVLSYTFIRIITIHLGQLSFTIAQFILALLILFYYIKFIMLQLNYHHYLNQKFYSYLEEIKHKLFGKDFNQANEVTVLVFALNIILTFYTLLLVFNVLNISDIYKYKLIMFSSLKIQLGNLEISLNEIVTASLVFSIIMMTENILSNRFLSKKIDVVSSNIYITKKNIIHYFFMILAIITSMIILKISSNQITFVLGSIALGASLGMKNIIENLIYGILLILNKKIFVGEDIQIINDFQNIIVQGRVLHIYFMNTIIVNINKEIISVPNSKFYTNNLKKITSIEDNLQRVGFSNQF